MGVCILECRVLKCWDTREIEKIYDKNRLTRRELISGIKWIWDLIEEHEKRCSYEKIGRLAKELGAWKTKAALEDIFEVKGGVDND